MQAIVDGMLTHYERSGSGPSVLILPGWADTSASWATFRRDLGSEFDVIILDIPGFGGSQAPESAWGLDDFAEFIQKFLQKIGNPKLSAVIGHSNGGAMAIRAISGHEVAPQKLILVASAGIRGQDKAKKQALKILAKTGKVLTAPLPNSTRKKLRAKLYSAAGSDYLVAEHMQETFKRVVAQDVRSDAAKIHIPTLLVYGDNDTAAPLEFGRIYHQAMKNSELKVIAGGGHFLHVDYPERLAKDIKEFLT